MGVIKNDKRFAFRQSEYILRTSSIFGGDTDGKQKERYTSKKQPPLAKVRLLFLISTYN